MIERHPLQRRPTPHHRLHVSLLAAIAKVELIGVSAVAAGFCLAATRRGAYTFRPILTFSPSGSVPVAPWT